MGWEGETYLGGKKGGGSYRAEPCCTVGKRHNPEHVESLEKEGKWVKQWVKSLFE